MKGFVRYLNLQNGLVAVETNEGFTVFEVRECCAIDIGDEISGPLDLSGEETLRNATKDESFGVFIERIGVAEQRPLNCSLNRGYFQKKV